MLFIAVSHLGGEKEEEIEQTGRGRRTTKKVYLSLSSLIDWSKVWSAWDISSVSSAIYRVKDIMSTSQIRIEEGSYLCFEFGNDHIRLKPEFLFLF